MKDRVGPCFEGWKGEKLFFGEVICKMHLARWVALGEVEGCHSPVNVAVTGETLMLCYFQIKYGIPKNVVVLEATCTLVVLSNECEDLDQ